MNPRRAACLLAALALSGPVAGMAAEPAGAGTPGSQDRGAGRQREYIYGAELMTPQERERYRVRLRKAQDEGREEAERDGHRRRIRERARERGVTLQEPAGVLRPPEHAR